jgi:L-fucose isomerase-like protein
MVAAEGSTEEFPRERFAEAREYWPHALIRLKGDPRALVQNLRSNHMHLCLGAHLEALRELCHWLGVQLIGLE